MNQFVVTPAAGKRVIAQATATLPRVQAALASGTVVIVAGTTNGYVAEEILKNLGQSAGFDRSRFFRGITMPPGRPTTETGRLPDESQFPGDVVIVSGEWRRARGPRLFPVPGEIITEIEALSVLTGVTANLVAGGGVCGAEGSVWLAISGSPEQEEAAQRILKQVAGESPFLI